MKRYVITISHQCGSGGHTIGKTVAERLGIPFYDKKLVQIVAERSGLSPETVEKQGEYHTPSLLYNIATGGYSAYASHQYSAENRQAMRLPDQINAYQTELIKELAEKEPCVIVGRCADSVLRDREDCFHVFIFGTLGDRADRVVAEHGIDPKAAEGHVRERDKKRAAYYKHITDKVWGMSSNYDLCLNSSKLGIGRCVELILAAAGAGTGS